MSLQQDSLSAVDLPVDGIIAQLNGLPYEKKVGTIRRLLRVLISNLERQLREQTAVLVDLLRMATRTKMKIDQQQEEKNRMMQISRWFNCFEDLWRRRCESDARIAQSGVDEGKRLLDRTVKKLRVVKEELLKIIFLSETLPGTSADLREDLDSLRVIAIVRLQDCEEFLGEGGTDKSQ